MHCKNTKTNGFTLIETLLVMGITVVMTAVLFAIKSTNTGSQEAQAASQQVTAQLRSLQNNAVNGMQINGKNICTFNMKVNGNQYTTSFYDCQGNATPVSTQSYSLKNVKVSLLNSSQDNVSFTAPRGDANNTISWGIIPDKNILLKITINMNTVGKIDMSTSLATGICTSFTYSSPWGACQPDGTQTRTITASFPAGCINGNPGPLSQSCTYVPPCTSYTYSDWGACQSNGTQTRTVATSIPTGCAGGATPVTSQTCTYVPPTCTWTLTATGACQSNGTQTVSATNPQPAGCAGTAPTTQTCTYTAPPTCSSWTLTPTQTCQPNGTQTVFASNPQPAGCVGGTAPTTQNCTYTAPWCTDFTYSCGACQSNNTMSCTVTNSLPSGCYGGNPQTTQSCTYTAPTCTGYTYSPWGTCQSDNTQTRQIYTYIPAGCSGGASPVLVQSCTYTAPTCTAFHYSNWGACQPGNIQTRTVVGSIPYGCVGGSPITTQSCTYVGGKQDGICAGENSCVTPFQWWCDPNDCDNVEGAMYCLGIDGGSDTFCGYTGGCWCN